MTASFYVWDRRRWSELDTHSGRVQGWRQRALFLYNEGGKLHLASTAAVLRGLRDLVAGRPTSVRDGVPLLKSRRKRASASSLSARCRSCKRHGRCCPAIPTDCNEKNKQNSPEEVNLANTAARVDTAVQVTLSQHSQNTPPKTQAKPLKRRRSNSSETVESKATQRRNDVILRRSSSVELRPTQKSPTPFYCKELVINEDDVDLYRSYLIKHDSKFDLYRFDTDESYKLSVFFRINPLVNIERCNLIKRMLRGSQHSQLSLKDFASQLGLRSISDLESVQSKRYKMRRRVREKRQRSTSDEDMDKENQSQFKLRKRQQLEFRKRQTPDFKPIIEKQNIVEETEHSSSSWLHSDSDSVTRKKKRRQLYQVTKQPIKYSSHEQKRILLKRNNPISSNNENVQTNNEKAQPKDSETHMNDIKSSLRKSKDVPQNSEDTTQKNDATTEKNDAITEKNVKKTLPGSTEDAQPGNSKARPTFAKVLWSSSDSEAGNFSRRQPRFVTKPAKKLSGNHPVFNTNAPATSKHNVSSKRGKEYASLEDHAIVAYISSGDRARHVNGNRVWRQLQDDYPGLTGIARTWHSLRNRYLRYILPTLGALALPHAHAARLRAAAARGAIKSKSKESRRQSIFSYPKVRSAFSSRPKRQLNETTHRGVEAETSDASPQRALRSSTVNDENQRDLPSQSDKPRKPSDKTRNVQSDNTNKPSDKTRNAQSDKTAISKDESKNTHLSRSRVKHDRSSDKTSKESENSSNTRRPKSPDQPSDENSRQKSRETRLNRSNTQLKQSEEQLSGREKSPDQSSDKETRQKSKDTRLSRSQNKSQDQSSNKTRNSRRDPSPSQSNDEDFAQKSKVTRLSRSRNKSQEQSNHRDESNFSDDETAPKPKNTRLSTSHNRSQEKTRSKPSQSDKTHIDQSSDSKTENLRSKSKSTLKIANDSQSRRDKSLNHSSKKQNDEVKIGKPVLYRSKEGRFLKGIARSHAEGEGQPTPTNAQPSKQLTNDKTRGDKMRDSYRDGTSEQSSDDEGVQRTNRPSKSRNKSQEQSRTSYKTRRNSEESYNQTSDETSDQSSDESVIIPKDTRLSRTLNKSQEKTRGRPPKGSETRNDQSSDGKTEKERDKMKNSLKKANNSESRRDESPDHSSKKQNDDSKIEKSALNRSKNGRFLKRPRSHAKGHDSKQLTNNKKSSQSDETRNSHQRQTSDQSSDEESKHKTNLTRQEHSRSKSRLKSDKNRHYSDQSNDETEQSDDETSDQSSDETSNQSSDETSIPTSDEDKVMKTITTRLSRTHNNSQDLTRSRRSQSVKTPNRNDISDESSDEKTDETFKRTRLSRSQNKSREQSQSKRLQDKTRNDESYSSNVKKKTKFSICRIKPNPSGRDNSLNNDQINQSISKSILKRTIDGHSVKGPRSPAMTDGQSTPTYSQLSKQIAKRGRSTPNSHESISHDSSIAQVHSPRKLRKLYNPKAGFG